MEHLNAIRAALKAAAPVVAIPMEGHAPICIKAKLLKNALKGVTVLSVKVLKSDESKNGPCWLMVTGRAGYVRTSCKFAPMGRYEALRQIGEWSRKERDKRIKVACQGILSAQEQRAMKLKAAEKAGIAELIAAQKAEKEILAEARGRMFPVITPMDDEERTEVIKEWSEYHSTRPMRKRGSVIQWRIKTLKDKLDSLTVTRGKRYERKTMHPRKKSDILTVLALTGQIKELEAKFETLYPATWMENKYVDKGGYFVRGGIVSRPKSQAYSVPWDWKDNDGIGSEQVNEDGETYFTGLKRLAERLKDARADIRALTPPADEQEELPLAA